MTEGILDTKYVLPGDAAPDPVAPVPAGPGRAVGRRRRRWLAPYLTAVVATDVAGFLLAGLVASSIRVVAPVYLSGGLRIAFPVWMAVTPAVWVACLASANAYDPGVMGAGSEEYRRVLSGALRYVGLLAIVSFALKASVGRELVLVVAPLALGANLLTRKILRASLSRVRVAGRLQERVVVVGRERETRSFVSHLRHVPGAGIQVVGLFDGTPAAWAGELGIPVIPDREALFALLRAGGADSVAVVDSHALGSGGLRELGWALEGLGVDVMVAPEVTDVAGPRLRIRPVGGLPLVRVDEPRLSGPVRLTKEVIERAGAAVGLVLATPVMVVVAAAIKVSSPGPVLFRQTRVGRDSRPFDMLKFRTMYVDAEQRRQDLVQLNEADGLLFKIRRDPRVTPVGRWLRRFSLDELPQLWNVLIGQMAVVGPRPPLPAEVALYPSHVKRRLLVKPGLTGLWQVNGRANLSWEDSVRLDLYYVDNWSVTGDLIILARTLGAVLRGSGAY